MIKQKVVINLKSLTEVFYSILERALALGHIISLKYIIFYEIRSPIMKKYIVQILSLQNIYLQ